MKSVAAQRLNYSIFNHNVRGTAITINPKSRRVLIPCQQQKNKTIEAARKMDTPRDSEAYAPSFGGAPYLSNPQYMTPAMRGPNFQNYRDTERNQESRYESENRPLQTQVATTSFSTSMSLAHNGFTSESLPRPLPSHPFGGRVMQTMGSEQHFDNFQTMTERIPHMPYSADSIMHLPMPHGRGITSLSPLTPSFTPGLPFTPTNQKNTVSPYTPSLRPHASTAMGNVTAGTVNNRSFTSNSSRDRSDGYPSHDRSGGHPSHDRSDGHPSHGRSNGHLSRKGKRKSASRYPRFSLPKPVPTSEYLTQSQKPIQFLKTSEPLLLVLDLNGTLLYRPDRTKPTKYIERPFMKGFLTYAFKNHKLMVWSSAIPHNVTMLCRQLFPKSRGELVARWSRDDLDLTEQEYYAKSPCYKRLERIWADPKIQATYPRYMNTRGPPNSGEAKWDQTNTVLIDDTLDKARGQPHNLIQIPEFNGQDTADDTVLAVLIDYLEILGRQVDVSRYIREVPFDYETLKAKYSHPDYGLSDEEGTCSEDSSDSPQSIRSGGNASGVKLGGSDLPTHNNKSPTEITPTSVTQKLSQTSLNDNENKNDNESVAPSSPPYSPHLSSPPYSPQFTPSRDSANEDYGGVPLPYSSPSPSTFSLPSEHMLHGRNRG